MVIHGRTQPIIARGRGSETPSCVWQTHKVGGSFWSATTIRKALMRQVFGPYIYSSLPVRPLLTAPWARLTGIGPHFRVDLECDKTLSRVLECSIVIFQAFTASLAHSLEASVLHSGGLPSRTLCEFC
jgi:hypothetical protein